MIHEKTFTLAVDREAKIIVKGDIANNSKQIDLDFEFLIKEKHDKYFRVPIGVNHPKYWKLRSLTPTKSKLMQLVYSGVSRKQLDAAIREFKQFFGPGVIFKDSINVDEKLKTLKGIRLTDINRKLLAAV